MSIVKIYNVIGIMSGTSMDGVDCSYLRTDGESSVSVICESTYKYSINYKNKLEKIVKNIKTISKNKKINILKIMNKLLLTILLK